jgi:hypothetical protein
MIFDFWCLTTRLAAASDKVYQLLAHGRWFSPDTPAFSTTKTGRHDIAEILLKVALNTKNQKIIDEHDRLSNIKPAHAITSIKQSPVLKGHIFIVLSKACMSC